MKFLTILYFSFKSVLRQSLSHASTFTGFAAPIFYQTLFSIDSRNQGYFHLIKLSQESLCTRSDAHFSGFTLFFNVIEIRTCLWEGLCLPGPMISFLSTILLSNRQTIAQAQSICSKFGKAEPSWQHRAQQNAKQQQSILVDQFAHFQNCLSPICLD